MRHRSEEATLEQLRRASGKTQKEVAEFMQSSQGAVSRIERRADVRLSTMRKYVEAIGGRLNLVISFDDAREVRVDKSYLDN